MILGYNNVDYTGTNQYIAPKIFDDTELYFLLKSDDLSVGKNRSVIRTKGSDSTIMVIPNLVNFTSINIMNNSFEQWVEYQVPKELTSFDIKLTDSDNIPIELNGRKFVVILELVE